MIWQDDFCRVVLLGDKEYPGYCRVELLQHVKEMTDLPIHERSRLMQTVCVVEQALRDLLNPTKINLASLGNKTPHLHWHIIPRFEEDKHFPNSHWGEITKAVSSEKCACEKPLSLLQINALEASIELALQLN